MAASVAALLFSACGKKASTDESPSTENVAAKAAETSDAAKAGADAKVEENIPELPAGFPTMTASYKAVYESDMAGAGRREVTIETIGGKKLRFETPHFNSEKAAAGMRLVGVFDETINRSVVFVDGKNASKVAVVLPQKESSLKTMLYWSARDGAMPKKVGADKIAGLDCEIWETPAEEGEAAGQACITRDGILLKGGDAGETFPDLVAKKVEKGPVAAERFVVPKDFEVIDLEPCTTAMEKTMEVAEKGKMPDMSVIVKCQGLMRKAGEILSDFQ